MRILAVPAVLATALLAAPQAHALDREPFINAQIGRIALHDAALDNSNSNFLQLGGGYRWGIAPFKAGIEASYARVGEVDGQRNANGSAQAVAYSADQYSIGANARIKPPLLPVQFIGRAGYMGMRGNLEQTAGAPGSAMANDSSRHSSGGTYAGVGIGTTALPLVDVSLMYNQYNHAQVEYDGIAGRYRMSGDKRNSRSLSLAVEYRF